MLILYTNLYTKCSSSKCMFYQQYNFSKIKFLFMFIFIFVTTYYFINYFEIKFNFEYYIILVNV